MKYQVTPSSSASAHSAVCPNRNLLILSSSFRKPASWPSEFSLLFLTSLNTHATLMVSGEVTTSPLWGVPGSRTLASPILYISYRSTSRIPNKPGQDQFRSNAKNTILPRFYFSAIRNCITLKQRWRGLRPLCRFTTIRNYITLKLGYTTTFNSSGRGLIFLLFLSPTLFLISFSFYHNLYSEASWKPAAVKRFSFFSALRNGAFHCPPEFVFPPEIFRSVEARQA